MADLVAAQQDIAQAISSGMRLRLRREERTHFDRAATEDKEAYLLYLNGVHHWYKTTPAGTSGHSSTSMRPSHATLGLRWRTRGWVARTTSEAAFLAYRRQVRRCPSRAPHSSGRSP